MANGTNRVAILIQNVSAVTGFARQGYSDLRQSLLFAACTIPGAIVGALAGTKLTGDWFNRVLAVIMIAVLVLMFRGPKPCGETSSQPSSPHHRIGTYAALVGCGFYGGFIQAGVGFLLMAALHRGWGLDLVRVNMHKVFIILIYSLPVLAVFVIHGDVDWMIGLALAAGNATGAWLASITAVKKGDRVIRAVLFITLFGMAIKLVLG